MFQENERKEIKMKDFTRHYCTLIIKTPDEVLVLQHFKNKEDMQKYIEKIEIIEETIHD